jgi:hypothetical protein
MVKGAYNGIVLGYHMLLGELGIGRLHSHLIRILYYLQQGLVAYYNSSAIAILGHCIGTW